MPNLYQLNIREKFTSSFLILVAVMFAVALMGPLLYQGTAGAATLSARSVVISDSTPVATGVTYDFTFTTQSLNPIQSMIFQFCDTPLGTCTLPGDTTNDIDVDSGTATSGAFTGTTATAFSEVSVDTGACDDADTGSETSTMLCVDRTEATNEAVGVKTFSIGTITNPAIDGGSNNEPIYVRISTFSDAAFATPVDDGVVATSIVNQLTVTGVVQERLVFCVFALDDAAGSNAASIGTGATDYPDDCTAAEAEASSSVNIGAVDNSAVTTSPVNNSPPTSIGNDRFGAAMVNTNATSGVTVAYYATQASSGTNELRAFRVAGSTCNVSGTDLTDTCFVSAANAGETYVVDGSNQERFGMQIACIANSNTIAAGTTANLGSGGTGTGASGGTFNTAYSNTDDDVDDDGGDDCENSDAGIKFAWEDSATAASLVHSSTVVDDELIKLRFGALAEATTPTGTYTVASTFIATPVF